MRAADSVDQTALGALNHMSIFVSLEPHENEPDENHLYLVDVGFGALNINAPLRLCEQTYCSDTSSP